MMETSALDAKQSKKASRREKLKSRLSKAMKKDVQKLRKMILARAAMAK